MRDFAELAHLDTEVLRSLLEAGEAPERVRAAWALALRLGGTIRPGLVQGSLTEPDPGVRRHLVVVLAGYQERAVLATLALQDFAAEVRAVACQYLAMIGRPEDAGSWRVLHERLEEDASAEVRGAAIAYLPPHTPTFLRSPVAARLEDESLEVRRAVTDKLLEWAGLSGEGLPEVLVSRLHLEPDLELHREWVRRACALGGEREFLEALVDAPEGTLRFVLELYAAQRVRLPWECLRPFTQHGRPGLDSLLIGLLEPGPQDEADVWLLEVALRSWRDSTEDYDSESAWAARDALASAPGTPAARPRALARAGPLFSPTAATPGAAPPSAAAPPRLVWVAPTPRSARRPPSARRRHPAPASGSAESPAQGRTEELDERHGPCLRTPQALPPCPPAL